MKSILFAASLALALAAPAARAQLEAPSAPAPEGAPAASAVPAHPAAADLEFLLGALASRGIAVDPPAIRKAVYECVARTADPQARLFTADELAHFHDEQRGRDFQVLLRVTMSNAVPVVTELDDAAAGAGLRTGDTLVAIGGVATTNTTLGGALRLLRGHGAEPVALVARHPDGSVVTAELARTLAPLRAVETAEALSADAGYLRLNGVFAGTGRDVAAQFRAWSSNGLFGFVLDLRGAHGADLESVAELGSLFSSPGSLLYTYRDLADQDLASVKASAVAPLEAPLMVLVDGATAGAAEALAAVLADSARGALLIGQPTQGDPLVRDALELPEAHRLYIATRRLVTGNGNIYDGRAPVPPDLEAPAAAAGADYEPDGSDDRRAVLDEELADRALRARLRGDAALTRAVDVLLGLKALNIRPGGVSSP